MGGSCSHAADAWANLATKEELREAVKSIEAWQRLQDQSRAAGHAAGNRNMTKGPLLQRVGGLDVVKQIVEGFYRRLYSDKRLLVFLHDKDMTYLRAKQTLFMSWLFGPPNQPYTGRNVRVAHLKLIKQRGFSAEDFDLGMEYFEQAMRELEAPESLISEVMARVLPFKTVIFTPCDKDADEEARWAFEERLKEQQAVAKEKEKGMQALKSASASKVDAAAALAGQSSRALATGASGALAGVGNGSGSGSGPQCPFTGATGAVGGNSSSSSNSNRGPQCPFTSGRLSSPASVTAIRVSGEILTPAPPAPPPPAATTTSIDNHNNTNTDMVASPLGSQSRPAATASSPANTCPDGSEAPAAPAGSGGCGGGGDVPAAVAAAAAATYASSSGCDDLKALARELQPQASKQGSRRSFDTPQPRTPEAGSRPGSSAVAAAAAAPQRQIASPGSDGSRLAVAAAAAASPQSRTPEAGSRPAAAVQRPDAEIRPVSAATATAAPELQPSSSGLSPAAAATGPREQPGTAKSGSRPASAAATPPPPPAVPSRHTSAAAQPPPPPQPQPVSRPPSAQAQLATQAAKAGSRPPSAIPQPPPKKLASRPVSAVPLPPPLAPQHQAGGGSRPASAAVSRPPSDGPFSVACDLASLARSASQALGGGGATAAAGMPPAVAGGSMRRLTTGPCAESAEVDSGLWEAEITAAVAAAAGDVQGARPGPAAAAAAAANGLPQARTSARSLGALEGSVAAAAGGGGAGCAKPERPALLALEMAVEMGLAEPEEGEGGGAAGGGAGDGDGAAAAASGGVEIVDAFLTEMLEQEAQAKAE